MNRFGLRVVVIAAALAGALLPVAPLTIERLYSSTFYPVLQRSLTGISNLVPFALFDLFGMGIAFWWLAMTVRDIVRRGARPWSRVAMGIATRTLVTTAGVYLAFLISWGLNYRRVPLSEKLEFDPSLVSSDRVRELAVTTVDQLNALYVPQESTPAPTPDIDPSLAPAFELAQEMLGLPYRARPARPKRTVIDGYFKAAAVEGMTAPFFMETLVPSDLLRVERPAVIAHEWSHLAGFADEGEASFVAWLTCLRGSRAVQYSGWLFLYAEAVGALPPRDRSEVAARLGSGPREDLLAIAARRRQNVRPVVATAGWEVYDRYLKANRVEAGAASYREVLRLVLGARFEPGWRPALKP
jgi:hypothetical protein